MSETAPTPSLFTTSGSTMSSITPPASDSTVDPNTVILQLLDRISQLEQLVANLQGSQTSSNTTTTNSTISSNTLKPTAPIFPWQESRG
ncbi:hypothetical protein VKT23_017882 [Stygiomarasmius scandens]|uniref:Uncharacterized protein n=1 Tax=Marasmiellus scandens TaxID=2682957 RepID=A0ABR1IQR5_9AGAR